MKNHIVIITIITLFSFYFANAQEKKMFISGIVKDSINKNNVAYVSVAIYKMPEKKLITGTMTDEKGEFKLSKLGNGNYTIKLTFVGYETKTIAMELNEKSVTIENPIYLKENDIILNEVLVNTSAKKETQISAEKTKINVSKNIAAVSGNLTEVLKGQSSITIDAENNLYLRGNNNILILLDGVPTTISSLNSIPASNTESIEIITNPSVKYDAEGTAGIINIVSKKTNHSGFNGSTTLNYGFNNRINGGLNLNYSKNKWNFGFGYNGKYEKTEIESDLKRFLYSQNLQIDQSIFSEQTNSTQNVNFNVSVNPTKKDFVSFIVKYVTPTAINNQNVNGVLIDNANNSTNFKRLNNIEFSRKNIETALSYKKVFEKNKNELSFDFSYSHTKGSRPVEYFVENQLLQKSLGGGTPTNITFQTDYLKSVSKKGTIETGLKVFSRWNDFNYNFYDLNTTNNIWEINPAFSNDLEHKEYIYSGYLMYSDSIAKKTFYKIGARAEYNTSQLVQNSINETIDKKYFFPFPFLQVKHTISKEKELALSINRRITRPTYPQLNPFINVIDQLTYETGNKNLDPEILDKIELNYSYNKNKFQLKSNLYFSSTNNYITQVSALSGSNLILTYINGDRQNKIGTDLDINYKFNKYISINPSFSVFNSKTTGTYNEINLATNDVAWTTIIKANIKPMQNTEIQLFYNYNSKIELPQFELDKISYFDIAVKRMFADNRLAVSATLTDVFNTRDWHIKSDNAIYKLENFSKNQSRIFWVGLTYNFNNYKIKKQNNTTDEESNKVKIGQ